MTSERQPMRRCIGCRTIRPRSELQRYVRTSAGEVVTGDRAPGRGAWLCSGSEACAQLAAERRAFDRAFRAPCRSITARDLLLPT